MKKIIAGTLLTFSLGTAGGDIVMTEEVTPPAPMAIEDGGDWKQSLTLYGWLPSLDGTLKYDIPGDDAGTSASDIISKLDIAFMGSYIVRKNKWSFFADAIYFKMSDSQEVSGNTRISNVPYTVSSEQELTTWVFGGYVGYNLLESGTHTIDAIAGLRYLSLEADISLSLNNLQRSVSPSAEFYDGVIGVQGITNINENWYVPYHFDIGAGDSDLTALASAGLGYRFGWGDVRLSYRYLYYDEGTDALVNSLDAYGPQIGVTFHF